MYQQQKNYGEFFLISFLLAAVLWSCQRDKGINNNTPAHYILESEQLNIPSAVDLSANLPGGNTRVATFYAEGVQKYKAQQKAGSSPAEYEWVFIAPQADLYDISNMKVGTHSAGPTWQLSGSSADSIYGQQFSPPKTAPANDANSVDWLLLMPKAGKTPTGIFANVDYIQRIATRGGKAPATAPQNANETIDVPYAAIYRFSKKNP